MVRSDSDLPNVLDQWLPQRRTGWVRTHSVQTLGASSGDGPMIQYLGRHVRVGLHEGSPQSEPNLITILFRR